MILGISGKAESGKDTVCEMIIGILSYKNKCDAYISNQMYLHLLYF